MSSFIHGNAKRTNIQREVFAQSSKQDELQLFEYVNADSVNYAFQIGYTRQLLPSLCETRWLARVDAISTLLAKYSDIYETVTETANCGGPGASEAVSYQLCNVCTTSVGLLAAVSQYVLAFTRPLSLSLQGESCNLAIAHDEMQTLMSVLQKQRSDDERACTIGSDVFGGSLTPDKPRVCNTSRNRANAGELDQTMEEYYRRNCYFHFLNAAKSNLKQRFPKGLRNALLGSYLVPHRLHQLGSEQLQYIEQEFASDLSSPETLEQEVRMTLTCKFIIIYYLI